MRRTGSKRSPFPSRSTHIGVGKPLPLERKAKAEAGEGPAQAAAERPERVAVIVAHGMGQQAHFETLEAVAEVLRDAEKRKRGVAPPLIVRMVKLAERELPRAEIRVTTAAGQPREVHLYESYWAPLTEGKVTTAEAVRFLIGSGLRGLWHSVRRRPFERYMFDRPIRFDVPAYALLQFLGVLLVLLSLLAINAIMVALLTSRLVAVSAGGLPGDPMFADLTMDLGLGLAGIFAGVVLATVTPSSYRWLVRRLFRLLRSKAEPPRRTPRWVMTLAWGFMLVGLGSIVVTAGAMLWHGWAHLRGAEGRLVVGGIADAIFADFGPDAWTPFQWVAIVGTWVGGGFVNYFARRFTLQYVGDVAVYISAHTLSRFAEVRNQIQTCAREVAEAVYRARGDDGDFDYPSVVTVGHSLGSVIAYDALNAMFVRDALGSPPLEVAKRTPLFLTFGSPLDKTAYIYRAQGRKLTGAREALAAAKQPMILSYDSRPARWVNIHSPNDWISGALEFYDDKDQTDRKPQWVRNERDHEASTPLAAHNEYWRGQTLANLLYEAVTA